MERQAEYISDGNYNYLRINYGEEGKRSYSYRMIMENGIKGLLPCRVRVVNGDTYLYYEVQSKQTLECRYEIKEIDYESLKNLFFHLCILGKELEKYLLDLDSVVFNEKYIFQDVETGETGFIFLPNKGKEDNYAEFMEYIVKRIDHKDMRAVKISYQLYDLSRREHISVKEIWALFEEEESGKKEAERIENNDPAVKGEVWGNFGDTEEEKKAARTESSQSKIQVDYEEVKEEKLKWKEILISCLLVIVFTILLGVKILLPLTYEEDTLVLAGIVVDAALFFLHMCYKYRKQKKETKEALNRCIEENVEKKTYEDVALESVYEREPSYSEPEKDAYGATVFLEPELENILYGLGKYEKTVIKIDKFPFTIGKLKEETDYVLKENSISRLHARLYQEKKEVYVMDLNSTNGTYKNGFRIPANQKVLLEEGDELTFGKIRFYYR